MDAKLTLKLDKAVIEKAKEYASANHKSLSRMIENYLKAIVETQSDKERDDDEISPFVKSLRTGVKVPDDFDTKESYSEYLLKKYE